MPEQERQPTAESHQSVQIQTQTSQTYKRTLTRKNPQTGRSNYPAMQSGRITNTNYQNGKKTITTKQYRRIQPND